MENEAAQSAQRAIESVLSGRGHGDINAVIATEALRRRLAPFVFLDHFDVETSEEWGFPYHPHSGVATFTYPRTSDLRHEDTGGNAGTIGKGGVQWMAAGGGLWHQELYEPDAGRVEGLQLWMLLPPDRENGPVEYQEVGAAELPRVDDTRVLAGSYGEARSPIETPYPFNYFEVSLDGSGWSFQPPSDHDVAWLYVSEGEVRVRETTVPAGHLLVFDGSSGCLEVAAAGAANFVVGTAAAFSHDIVFGRFSMHTSEAALQSGLQRVRELAGGLRAAGKIG